MNRRVMDYLMDKMDSRRGISNRRDRREDFEEEEDFRDNRDSRRGVRGSGRSRRDMEDEAFDERDRRDNRDRRDSLEVPSLSKSDMHHWKQMLENFDGTKGPHYDMQQIIGAADKQGVKFKDFDESEFCLVVNWLYSDYCRALKKHVSHEDMLFTLVDMAKDFFDDPDGIEPSERLAMLYHCVINV